MLNMKIEFQREKVCENIVSCKYNETNQKAVLIVNKSIVNKELKEFIVLVIDFLDSHNLKLIHIQVKKK